MWKDLHKRRDDAKPCDGANRISEAGDVTFMVYVNVQNSLPAARRPYHFRGDIDGLFSSDRTHIHTI
jgi:hypothetical protein